MSDRDDKDYVVDLKGVDEDSVPPPEKDKDEKNYDNIPVGPAEGYVPEDEADKGRG